MLFELGKSKTLGMPSTRTSRPQSSSDCPACNQKRERAALGTERGARAFVDRFNWYSLYVL